MNVAVKEKPIHNNKGGINIRLYQDWFTGYIVHTAHDIIFKAKKILEINQYCCTQNKLDTKLNAESSSLKKEEEKGSIADEMRC